MLTARRAEKRINMILKSILDIVRKYNSVIVTNMDMETIYDGKAYYLSGNILDRKVLEISSYADMTTEPDVGSGIHIVII